ncbi:hypothetical protein EV356DRAFT_133099 [Viridothelium virens]|uniref:Uncharacterized protein n=1 Tax=Viridothelium virens TaxID=1048519 RepID=A0A6A6HA46_VIRVR|nr:hypothetical protein EV356DRAFT_133099 [Viridothelium virens]
MCFQIVERYSVCRCLYYKHPIDRCPAFGQKSHAVPERIIFVGYSCAEHSRRITSLSRRVTSWVGLPIPSLSRTVLQSVGPHIGSQTVQDPLNDESPQRDDGSDGPSSQEDSASACDSTLSSRLFSVYFVSEPPKWLMIDLDHIVDVILQDNCLVENWRFMSETRSEKSARRASARLLERFSNDLLAEASSLHERKVCRFLRRNRQLVAKKILNEVEEKTSPAFPHQEPSDHSIDIGEEELGPVSSETGSSDGDGYAAIETKDQETEHFVLSSEAFKLFKANLINHIAPEPTTQGSVSLVLQHPKKLVKLILGEPKVAPGMSRVRWTCHCGREMFDDYIETRPGGLKTLEKMLNRNRMLSSANPDLSNPNSGRTAGYGLFEWVKGLMSFQYRSKQPALPQHRDNTPNRQQPTPLMRDTRVGDLEFLLLCVPHRRHGTKMINVDVVDISSDVDFFLLLRRQYHSRRGRFFEAYVNNLADIHKLDSIPSESMRDEYTYYPMPAEHIPPIGPNMLKHLYDHPEEAKAINFCFRKVPKKRKEKLVACPIRGSRTGWGIQYIEGIHWLEALICGLLAITLSTVTGIGWSVLRDDVQGGFTIASFMLTALTCLMGLIQSHLEVL